jgi:hypothetical protein
MAMKNGHKCSMKDKLLTRREFAAVSVAVGAAMVTGAAA